MAYQRIAKFIPKKIAAELRKNLRYAGFGVDAERVLGWLIAYPLALSVGIAVNLFLIFGINPLIGFVGIFLLFFGSIYLWISIAAENKGRFVEGVLPDALQLIASNIKSGLTTERALFVSARPEFGPLETELKNSSKMIMAGTPIEKAVQEMGENVRSVIFQRTMWLIARGIESGGQIADLLIQLGDDIREQKAVQDESRAETSMYIILIFIAAAFGGPILFGISTFIVEIMTVQIGNLTSQGLGTLVSQSAGGGNLGILTKIAGGERNLVSPEFIVTFSIIALLVTSIFAALTLGIINSGKEKNGVKFIPFILIVGLILFYSIRFLLKGVFGSILGI